MCGEKEEKNLISYYTKANVIHQNPIISANEIIYIVLI